jgi:hypothetical protein
MRDWRDELLAGLRIPRDSGAGINDYCLTRGWQPETTSRCEAIAQHGL